MSALLCICIVAFKSNKFNLNIKKQKQTNGNFSEAKVKFFIIGIRESVEITLGLFSIKKT